MKENFLINFNFYLVFSNVIFVGGIFSILLSKNLINWLISIELLFLSSFFNFILFSLYYLNIDGFIYALIIIILAAAESALGLSLIAVYYKNNKTLEIVSTKKSKK